MTIIFLINSKTVDIDRYNIKDIPGSSGRLDVISRCILAALIGSDSFEKNVQIWVFLDNYGTFIFNSNLFHFKNFPKNELQFSDCFVKFLQKDHNGRDQSLTPLNQIQYLKMNIVEAIRQFQKKKYSLYILYEKGQDFFKVLHSIREKENIVFIIGSQEDDYIHSTELSALKIPMISIGNQSYLASSVIRLLKLYLLAL